MKAGFEIFAFRLSNDQSFSATLIEYGAAISSILIPNNHKQLQEVCLGYDNLASYIKDTESIGVTVGRYANRIENACFNINNINYQLDANIPPHQIHGGTHSFGKQVWTGEIVENGVTFHHHSPDGANGFPGNYDFKVTYQLTEANELKIEYTGKGDKDCFINLTNHAYFSLSNENTICNHQITIHSDQITPLNNDFLVTDEIHSVSGTIFDLQQPTPVILGLDAHHPQIVKSGGYDINYIMPKASKGLTLMAEVNAPENGLWLKVKSNQPCLQFYTGNNLADKPARHMGKLEKHAALCLEAQDFPNGPNLTTSPTSPIRAGETYHKTIIYQFGTK